MHLRNLRCFLGAAGAAVRLRLRATYQTVDANAVRR
jgi:hypothetical protein